MDCCQSSTTPFFLSAARCRLAMSQIACLERDALLEWQAAADDELAVAVRPGHAELAPAVELLVVGDLRRVEPACHARDLTRRLADRHARQLGVGLGRREQRGSSGLVERQLARAHGPVEVWQLARVPRSSRSRPARCGGRCGRPARTTPHARSTRRPSSHRARWPGARAPSRGACPAPRPQRSLRARSSKPYARARVPGRSCLWVDRTSVRILPARSSESVPRLCQCAGIFTPNATCDARLGSDPKRAPARGAPQRPDRRLPAESTRRSDNASAPRRPHARRHTPNAHAHAEHRNALTDTLPAESTKRQHHANRQREAPATHLASPRQRAPPAILQDHRCPSARE